MRYMINDQVLGCYADFNCCFEIWELVLQTGLQNLKLV